MLKVVRHRDVAFTNCPGAHFLWPENNWPLESPRPSENATGNTFIPCKNELIEEAARLPKFRGILLVNERNYNRTHLSLGLDKLEAVTNE